MKLEPNRSKNNNIFIVAWQRVVSFDGISCSNSLNRKKNSKVNEYLFLLKDIIHVFRNRNQEGFRNFKK